jgi:hypothetical protein
MNMSSCWIVAAMNVIFMFVLPFIVNAMKTSNERLLQQARLQKEFDMEMARFSTDAYSTDPYTGTQVDPYGAPVSGGANGYGGHQGLPFLNGGQQVSGPYNPYGDGGGYPYPSGGVVYAQGM